MQTLFGLLILLGLAFIGWGFWNGDFESILIGCGLVAIGTTVCSPGERMSIVGGSIILSFFIAFLYWVFWGFTWGQSQKAVQAALQEEQNETIEAEQNKLAAKEITSDCRNGAQITGKQYNVIGAEIDVRKGPGAEYEKIVNQKATDFLETTIFTQIDYSTVVFEECTKGEWSWIRVLEPDWLQNSHRGWVLSKHLDKGQEIGGDPYARKIGSYALTPYDAKNYPKTVTQFGPRLKEIEQFRRKIAEIVIDSGKCDFVETSDLSDKSSLQHLHFWVYCRNGERIRLDEFEIKKKNAVFTQREKKWDESSARMACREAIKSRVLIPSGADIHDVFGTSFYEAPVTHNVVLTMNFDAKNVFQDEIPYTAKCYFKPGEVGEIEIYERQ